MALVTLKEVIAAGACATCVKEGWHYTYQPDTKDWPGGIYVSCDHCGSCCWTTDETDEDVPAFGWTIEKKKKK